MSLLVVVNFKKLSSSSSLDGCSTSEDDVSKRGCKRKAAADGEGPSRKRKRVPNLKDSK